MEFRFIFFFFLHWSTMARVRIDSESKLSSWRAGASTSTAERHPTERVSVTNDNGIADTKRPPSCRAAAGVAGRAILPGRRVCVTLVRSPMVERAFSLSATRDRLPARSDAENRRSFMSCPRRASNMTHVRVHVRPAKAPLELSYTCSVRTRRITSRERNTGNIIRAPSQFRLSDSRDNARSSSFYLSPVDTSPRAAEGTVVQSSDQKIYIKFKKHNGPTNSKSRERRNETFQGYRVDFSPKRKQSARGRLCFRFYYRKGGSSFREIKLIFLF